MTFSLIDETGGADPDRRIDQGPACAVARRGAGVSAQLAACDRLFRRCRQARAGAGGEGRARPGAGRPRRAGEAARRCGRSPDCPRHCRKEAIGSKPFRAAPIRHGSRSAGRSAPMPSPATTPRAARPPALVWPEGADRGRVERLAGAVFLARDLVNTPAGDLGPEELAAAAVQVAETAGACHRVIVGDELLAENYPTIHAVGRASTRAPRLVDIVWGEPSAPKVTLVGKGVCFDTRRARPQARLGHAADEKGHGGRGDRARPRPGDHGREAAGAAARAAAVRREFGVRQRDAADATSSAPARG